MKKITFLIILLISSLGFSQNLLTNGDFEAGDGSSWGGNSVNGTNINVVDDGTGSNFVNQSIINTAGQGWQVGIDQALALTENESYELSFVASSDVNRTIIAGIGKAGGDFFANTVTQPITSTPTTYTFTLIANFNTVADGSRVLFDLGEVVSTVTLDDISLQVVVNTCNNGMQDGDETGVDCGGSCPNTCPAPPTVAAPTPPARLASDVLSFYSDAYASAVDFSAPPNNFDAGWCGTPSVTEELIAGDATQLYSGLACQGIDFNANSMDASDFTHFHVDFFTDDTDLVGKVFNLKLVDFGGGTAEVPANNIEININDGTTPGIVTGMWVSVDYVLPQSLVTTLGDLAQIGITSNLSNVWYDNLYLHKNTTLTTDEFNVVDFNVFPNPTVNNWNITANNNIKTITLYNILGKQEITLTPNTSEVVIDASTLNTGLYFAKIESDFGSKTIKLVKE